MKNDLRHSFYPGVHAYLVGGAVRDMLMGNTNPKDFDFSVEAKSFNQMVCWLEDLGFKIFTTNPEYLTARATKRGDWEFAGHKLSGMTYDFVMCRKDGFYSDGRHPDEVEPGTIFDDLARRDFTMNAIAIDGKGNILDPHQGQEDIRDEIIRCVGNTDRLVEDSVRVLRGLRFRLQTGFRFDTYTGDELRSRSAGYLLVSADENRVRDELTKMFKINTVEAIHLISRHPHIAKAVLGGNVWLKPTSEKK